MDKDTLIVLWTQDNKTTLVEMVARRRVSVLVPHTQVVQMESQSHALRRSDYFRSMTLLNGQSNTRSKLVRIGTSLVDNIDGTYKKLYASAHTGGARSRPFL